MALFKSASGQPYVSQRIDGAVWGAAGPGSTIRGWAYPTMRRSAQFGRFNDLLRAAERAWATMDPATKALWGAGALPWPPPGWWLWCWVRPIYPYPAWDGHDSYLHSQAWAALQGLPGPALPPTATAVPADDTFSLAWGPDMTVTWRRTPPGPAGGAYLAVFARAKLSSQGATGPHQRQVFVGVVPIVVGVAVSVGDLVRAAGQGGPGLSSRLLVMVGENGIYPLAAAWLLYEFVPASQGWGNAAWGSSPWGAGG